jgi:molybdopterin synthase catalytic subunit
MNVHLTSDTLDVATAIAHVAHAGAGAIDLFLGVVRSSSEGRDVQTLEYSAYEPMALREMTAIVAELESQLSVRATVAHRIGLLHVGDVAVICAVSAPHRAEAFLACRRLIDEIKARVPIWKRETGPDGAAWVGWVDARCHGEGHDHTPAPPER